MALPVCPKCGGTHTYEDGHLYICPLCFFEWTDECARAAEEASIIRDSNGNQVEDGDSATIIRDLKVGKDTIKQGTKVKGIRILDAPVDGHDIEGKVDGFGSLYLKSSVIKK